LAAELVKRGVDVIVTQGGIPPTRAAKSATSTIPIVFAVGTDPVEDGLVASLARPGGNLTGVTFMMTELNPKRLELLSELVPQARVITLLVNGGAARKSRMTNSCRCTPISCDVKNGSSTVLAIWRPPGTGSQPPIR
jgi:putative tryptophan/tyrosine transport system substrate-binding protein